MKITAQELFTKLTDEYKIIGKQAHIAFTLHDFSIKIASKDTVGNLLQDWLIEWMRKEGIELRVNPNPQTFPDVFLNPEDEKSNLLEIKSFDLDRGPGFDIANFDAYCNSLLTSSYRLDSDYLIIAYSMEGTDITIRNVWLKKIWEISGSSGKYPIKVQDKKNVIYSIRPIIWYSQRAKFESFASKEEFIKALNETRYQYPQTRFSNAHWLNNVIANYALHSGQRLDIR